MNLYKLERNRKDDRYYNGYSGAIVSAPTEQEARLIHPSSDMRYAWMDGVWMFKAFDGEYVIADGYWRNSNDLKVECVGTTHLPKGVVLASFNRV